MFYLNAQLLYLVPVAAVLAALLVLVNYKRRVAMHKAYGDWTLLSETSRPLAPSRYVVRALFAALAAALLTLALVRPVVHNGTRSIAQGSVEVIAAVDVSRSMAAMDYEGKVPQSAVAKRLIEPNISSSVGERKAVSDRPEDTGTRLEMVRHVLLDYMLGALDGNQLGIVSYAGEAYPQAFLTRDTSSLRWVIERGLTISSAPGEGSAVVKALALTAAMFDADAPVDHDRLLVLFSDGGNDDDMAKLTEVALDLKARHIKLIVVAMGNVMPSKIPVSKLAADDDFALALQSNGKRWVEADGQIEKSGMDAPLLQALANQAGGQFIHMQNMSDLNLFNYLGQKSVVSTPGTMELFPYLIGLGLVFVLLAYACTNKWQRSKK